MSVKSSPMSLILPNSKEKSYLVNILDTPGHVNFSDEVTASLRLADGVVVFVDAIEGVMLQTERLLKHAILERLAITVVISKVDRLILELKLPPSEAYFKIKFILDQINKLLRSLTATLNTPSQDNYQPKFQRISPELGNVCFAAAEMGWCFTLRSFAKLYSSYYGNEIDEKEFAKRLWGDVYFIPESRKFIRSKSPPSDPSIQRSFVSFVLEPIYKLYGLALTEETNLLKEYLESFGIFLSREEYKLDIKPLLKLVLSHFFGKANGFVDMIEENIPDPSQSAITKIPHIYTGNFPLFDDENQQNQQNNLKELNDPKYNIVKSMMTCDPKGPLMINITKLYSNADGNSFNALGRVFSGTVSIGQKVRVLGEGYSKDDEEDMVVKEVNGVYISESRYNIAVEFIPAGNWVLLSGVDESIAKTATITDMGKKKKGDDDEELFIFRPLVFNTNSTVKIAVEPLNPSELPKMLDGLRKINKTYPLSVTKAEESGEHIILGTGFFFFSFFIIFIILFNINILSLYLYSSFIILLIY